MDQWYYARQGQRFGPCPLKKLKQLVAAGELQPDDLVWREGQPKWLPVKSVPELAAEPAAAIKTAPAAPPAPAKAPTNEPKAPAPARTAPRRSGQFLSVLHGLLPKPVLFGLYGALGALLGLLLLGELLFGILHPPKISPEVTLAIAPEITLFPGSESKLPVKIARRWFKGPVTLTVSPSPDVQISELTLPDGVTEGELVVKVGLEADQSGSHVQVTASAADANVKAASESFRLTVSALPPALRVAVSPAVAVYAGDKNTFTVKIARERFEGPVRVEVLDLPKDIQIPLVTLPEDKADAALNVTVGKNAAPVMHPLLVEARSLADHTIRSTDTLRLNIEPPPGKLQLAVANLITLFPGEKNKFTVKIARQEFSSPVEIEVEELPKDVQLAPVTIPKDKAEAEMEVSAGASAALATHPLRFRAKALDLENVTASLPVQLQITPPPPTLQLALSPKVSVYPGGKARFGVKIGRQEFDGAVRIDVQDRTGVIFGSPITIPAGQTEGELEISASVQALRLRLPYAGALQAVARSLDSKGAVATEQVQVEILAPPLELQLSVSPTVEAFQGGKFRFTVKAARGGFVGPIQLDFTGLPAGVTIDTSAGGKGRPRTLPAGTIPANANEVVLEGKASLRTAPGKTTVKMQGTGPAASDGKVPTKSAEFSLEIKPLDPSKRPPPIDAIFVLDATETMSSEIKGLRDGIVQFLDEMKSSELDARVGVVTFRDVTFDNVPPQVIKFNGEPFTSDPKVFSTEVGKIVVASGGDDPESSLEGLALAAQQPFRERALRVLLLITDDAPQTRGNSLPMEKALALLKEKKIDQIHLIVAAKDRTKYEPLHQVGKGGFFDIFQASRKGKGFAALLPELSKGIADTIEAAGPAAPKASDPPAPEKPADPKSIASEKPPVPRPAPPPKPLPVPPPTPPVVGVVSAPQVTDPKPPIPDLPTPPKADASGLKGLQSTQVFPEEYRFQLLAAIALWTAAMAGGIGLALVAGQKLYLQQLWPRWGEMGKAVAAGLAAGLLGGVIGQWFFQSAVSGSGSSGAAAVWEVISRVLAWGLLGGLLGAGMSVFVPNLRWQNGFLGGCIGGLIGALGFALFTVLAGPALGRWIGAALVGFFIGMMIAWAEKAFRRFWLEVKFGEREIRTFTLGPALVAVGGDEKAATVCVRDAPARALGYYVRGSRVLCEDFSSGKTADAPPGDQRKLASALLTVRSDANATPTGASLQLLQVRQVSLLEGMPLTTEDIPGLEPQGSDGVVALVSRRPSDPKVLLLRNRSKQPWIIADGGGERTVTPGMSVELSARCQINFGQVKGTLDFSQ